jgi:hypothetical protein
MDENVKLFEITIAGRLFAVAREMDDCNQFRQTYYVNGRSVPVQDYLTLLTDAGPARRRRGRTTRAKS